jgi:hypothetical protein
VEESASRISDLDTAKFALTYKLWGRYLYNPDTAPEVSHRIYRQTYGPAGPALETALAAASRILPLVTTAWCPSASNHEYWPEMLTPVSILPYTGRAPYSDSPAPHNVSAISPLDPQLFTTIGQHADNLVSGKLDARYNTSEVIAWLTEFVDTSNKGLEAARMAAGSKARTPEFRRAEEDILILNGLGRYYAYLFRTALLYSILKQSDTIATSLLIHDAYRRAIASWSGMATRAKSTYAADISYGSTPFRRGHWFDRLPAIQTDYAAVEHYLSTAVDRNAPHSDTMMGPAWTVAPRPVLTVHHTAPTSFHPGSELALAITTPPNVTEAILWYRHVNHGERWLSVPMEKAGATRTAAIPAAYTDSPYPLQYYFELHTATAATLHPAFNPTLSNQPYYAVHVRA